MPIFNVRKTLGGLLENVNQPVALAASAGIDSSCLLVSLLDVGIKPVCVSFTLDDRESTDFIGAKKLADKFKCEFYPVVLPTDADEVCAGVEVVLRHLIEMKMKISKTKTECLWPFLYVCRFLESEGIGTLVTGHAAGGHFGTSKKAMIHYKTPKSKFQAFRSLFFRKPDFSQRQTLTALGSKHGVGVELPFGDPQMFSLFEDASWDDLNKPKQKQALRQEYPELDELKIKNNMNFQLGDSGIADRISLCVRSRYASDARSAVTAYSRMARVITSE